MRREAVNWFEGALVDLAEAEGALRAGRVNWSLFAAHQAVEKALKAAIMAGNKRPPKTHDLTELYRVLGGGLSVELVEALAELTPYYTVSRYPNAGMERPWESIPVSLAERLLEKAKVIVREVGRFASLEERQDTE